MFRFVNTNTRGQKSRGEADIAVGDFVESGYRARWKGEVVALEPDGGIANVRMVIDRHNNPIRKQKTVRYHVHYFTKVPRPCYHTPSREA